MAGFLLCWEVASDLKDEDVTIMGVRYIWKRLKFYDDDATKTCHFRGMMGLHNFFSGTEYGGFYLLEYLWMVGGWWLGGRVCGLPFAIRVCIAYFRCKS